MSQPSSPRAAAPLSNSVHQHLNMYARAATAAGVGILALTPSANAKIIYTPANIPITPNVGLIELDINNDGVNDFGFSFTYKLPGGTHHLIAEPAGKKGRIWSIRTTKTFRSHHYCVAAVQSGSTIGAHSPFEKKHSPLLMDWGSRGTYGCPWTYLNVGGKGFAYVGLKFRVKGVVHFGWARVKMNGSLSAPTITGYAYETVGHKPIIAGNTTAPDVVTRRPVMLGHLARGAATIQPASPIN